MLVKKAMIVFKMGKDESPVVGYKYTSFEDPANTVETLLDDLPCNELLQ